MRAGSVVRPRDPAPEVLQVGDVPDPGPYGPYPSSILRHQHAEDALVTTGRRDMALWVLEATIGRAGSMNARASAATTE